MNPFNLIGLIILGAALLWMVNIVYGRRQRKDADILKLVLTIGGWVLLLSGVFAALSAAPGAGWIPLFPIAVIVVVMAARRFRKSENRALATVLAVAVERGIPLPRAIRAFAEDAADQTSQRARELARMLEVGAALPNAIALSNIRMDTDVMAAIEFGDGNGFLAPALRRVLNQSDNFTARLQATLEKLFYLFVVAVAIAFIVTFLMIKIIPTFDIMFQEFELELPAVTVSVIEISRFAGDIWPLWTSLLLVCLVFLLVYCLNYADLVPSDWPIVGRYTQQFNAATLLRLLSVAVEQDRPLVQAIKLLANRYPHRLIRRRLKQASMHVDNGADWRDAMRQVKLITAGEAAVLKSAQRVGNLAWALEELADKKARRVAQQSAALLNIMFPVVLVGFGLIGFMVVTAMLMPLASMINDLAL